MPDTFKALVINQEGEKFTRAVSDLNLDFLKDGDVLVKIDSSDLNSFQEFPGLTFLDQLARVNQMNLK